MAGAFVEEAPTPGTVGLGESEWVLVPTKICAEMQARFNRLGGSATAAVPLSALEKIVQPFGHRAISRVRVSLRTAKQGSSNGGASFLDLEPQGSGDGNLARAVAPGEPGKPGRWMQFVITDIAASDPEADSPLRSFCTALVDQIRQISPDIGGVVEPVLLGGGARGLCATLFLGKADVQRVQQ
eukprot:TRINITY_DN4639_c0_g2_i1.p3 TRINITY_DN4639_c0_g2~~TRINITY_DN4639_c0_g2_i1.p3  ORF type:complete len:184 (+),score=38.68 TRINITY_DN4639_c0_g2_i1:169-720(+)